MKKRIKPAVTRARLLSMELTLLWRRSDPHLGHRNRSPEARESMVLIRSQSLHATRYWPWGSGGGGGACDSFVHVETMISFPPYGSGSVTLKSAAPSSDRMAKVPSDAGKNRERPLMDLNRSSPPSFLFQTNSISPSMTSNIWGASPEGNSIAVFFLIVRLESENASNPQA